MVKVTIKSKPSVSIDPIQRYYQVLGVTQADLRWGWDMRLHIDGSGVLPYGQFMQWVQQCSKKVPKLIRDALDIQAIWGDPPMAVYHAHADKLRYNDNLGAAEQKIGELTI